MRVAVEGCGHGTLHAIYASIKKSCELNHWAGVDLLIIGGDFQAVRNSKDLNCMSVPLKYREIGDFHEYYSGARKAPYLTIFVGGNHEASSHLWELYYGGWVAPGIYYLGAANIIRVGPLRIAGLSGIWKGYNYNKPHHERLPYNQDDVKSIYHVRELDVRKLLNVRTQVDVGISHDWPRGIEWMHRGAKLPLNGITQEIPRRASVFGYGSFTLCGAIFHSLHLTSALPQRAPPPQRYSFSSHTSGLAQLPSSQKGSISARPIEQQCCKSNGTPTIILNAMAPRLRQ